MSEKAKIRIGVIGAGGRGLISRYAVEPGVGGEITALCDVDSSAFERYRDVVSSSVFTCYDYRELLARDLPFAAWQQLFSLVVAAATGVEPDGGRPLDGVPGPV